jgi:predicted nicotinamide N-methyase
MEPRRITICDKELVIKQDLTYGYAGEVWDAALVLSYFLISQKGTELINCKNKTILEIGSGTGIVGLVTSYLGAKKLYLTDKEECLNMLKINYEENKLNINNSEIVITSLNWKDKDTYSNIKDYCDIIIGSDIIWRTEDFVDIVQLLDTVSLSGSMVVLSYTFRKEEELDFFKKIEKTEKWIFQKIPNSFLDEEYRSDDIFIVLLIKK